MQSDIRELVEPSELEELRFMRLKPGRYRLLTLRQPWAWLVVFGGKDVENRSWTTEYRGPILIHAGKEMTRREYKQTHEYALRHDIEIQDVELTVTEMTRTAVQTVVARRRRREPRAEER